MLVNCIGDNAEQGSVTILVKCIGGDARQGVVDKVGHGSVDNARQDNTNNACQRIGDNAKHDRLHQTMLDKVLLKITKKILLPMLNKTISGNAIKCS